MTQHAILTAVGDDRPGLVDEVTRFLFERGGNIEDSRMVNLRGQFAMMVLIGGTDQSIDALRSDLPRLAEQTNLHAELRPAAPARPASADAMPYKLTATAIDQTGLVHRLSRELHAHDVNIESLDTRLAAAPYTGAPLFEMELIISVPRKTQIAELRAGLTRLCDDLNIDWVLAPA
jgi:glycine cleavage system transcriptional repressor